MVVGHWPHMTWGHNNCEQFTHNHLGFCDFFRWIDPVVRKLWTVTHERDGRDHPRSQTASLCAAPPAGDPGHVALPRDLALVADGRHLHLARINVHLIEHTLTASDGSETPDGVRWLWETPDGVRRPWEALDSVIQLWEALDGVKQPWEAPDGIRRFWEAPDGVRRLWEAPDSPGRHQTAMWGTRRCQMSFERHQTALRGTRRRQTALRCTLTASYGPKRHQTASDDPERHQRASDGS